MRVCYHKKFTHTPEIDYIVWFLCVFSLLERERKTRLIYCVRNIWFTANVITQNQIDKWWIFCTQINEIFVDSIEIRNVSRCEPILKHNNWFNQTICSVSVCIYFKQQCLEFKISWLFALSITSQKEKQNQMSLETFGMYTKWIRSILSWFVRFITIANLPSPI